MDVLFELLFQFLGEVLLQCVAEALFQCGFDLLASTFDRRKHRYVAPFANLAWGVIAGVISLLIVPHAMVTGHVARLIGVLAIPLICAALAVLVDRWRGKGNTASRFLNTFLFALAMTLVRFRLLPPG